MGPPPPDGGPGRAIREFFKDEGEEEDRQVVVVGAGPAGSTAARFAAAAGADVLLIDRRAVVGRPVQCAGYLPSEAELALMLPEVPDQRELYHVDERFVMDTTGETALVSPGGRAKTVPMEGRTIDRAAWDMHLVEAAVEAGAEFRPSTRAMGLEDGVLVTDRGRLLPSVIVAADGPHSRMRELAGLPEPPLIAPALNSTSEMDHGGRVEMHFAREAPGGYAWVIPAGDGRAHVGLGVDPRRGVEDLRERLGAFAARVGARLGEVNGGFVPSAGPVRATVSGNVLLAGDAAGHVMASNGGGVPIALACGRAAGQVAAASLGGEVDLSDYETRWRREVGAVLSTAARIRWMAGIPFRLPMVLEMAMWAMPRWEMARALRCQPLLWVF